MKEFIVDNQRTWNVIAAVLAFITVGVMLTEDAVMIAIPALFALAFRFIPRWLAKPKLGEDPERWTGTRGGTGTAQFSQDG